MHEFLVQYIVPYVVQIVGWSFLLLMFDQLIKESTNYGLPRIVRRFINIVVHIVSPFFLLALWWFFAGSWYVLLCLIGSIYLFWLQRRNTKSERVFKKVFPPDFVEENFDFNDMQRKKALTVHTVLSWITMIATWLYLTQLYPMY